jgi:hypothetical protein
VTKASDPFPTIIDGIPLQIGHVNVSIDRPGLHVQPDQLQTDEGDGDGDGRRRGDCCGVEPLPGHELQQTSNHHKQQP